MMLMIAALNTTTEIHHRDLLEVASTDLNLCPEKAQAAEFLQLMDGWL